MRAGTAVATPTPSPRAARLELPCSRCGELACSLELPTIPDNLRGFVGGLLALGNFKLREHGVQLTVPPSGALVDAIPREQLPAIAQVLDVQCGSCAGA